jgi:CheY-like chemotaxis protein
MDGFLERFASESAVILLASFDEEPELPRREKRDRAHSAREKKIGNRVLIVGRLRELALYRAEFLQHAGFIVSTPQDDTEALGIMQRGDFDAIVLSYTLSNETVQELAESAREYCPDCPIIAITETGMFDRRIAPDAVALANDGPGALLSALKRVLQRS